MNTLRTHLLFLTLLGIVTTIAYSNSFQGIFAFDDLANIINVQSIRLFQPDLEGIVEAASEGPNGRRWLPNLSFAINFYLHGENVWGYHLVNLLIHIGNSFALYFLFLTTLNLSTSGNRTFSHRELAFLAALLWAVHPIQTNGVTYIVQRMTSMSTFFYISSLLSYIYGRLSPPGEFRQIALYVASALLGFMAIVSKENALMLPVILFGYEVYFIQSKEHPHLFKKYALWGIVSIAAIAIIAFLFLGTNVLSGIQKGYDFRSFTMQERVLTQPRIIFFYISLLALPLPSRLSLNHDFSLSHGLLTPPTTLLAILGIVFLVVLVFISFRKNKLFSFALFWFLGNLVIESSIIPLELIYEHRLYVPSIFLFLVLTYSIFQFSVRKQLIARILLAALIMICSVWTWQRNVVWSDNLTLWSDIVKKSPLNALALNNLGTVYHDMGQYDKAEELFLQSIRLEPETRLAYVSLASLYLTENRYQEAMKLLQIALGKQTYLNGSKIYHYMGVILGKTGQYREAIASAQKALLLDPNDQRPLITMGIAYTNLEKYQQAVSIFKQAEKAGVNNTNLFNNWGIALFRMGLVDQAIELFNKALEIDPNHPESHYNLGLAYGAKGLVDEARNEMSRSIELRQKKQLPGSTGK